MFTLEEIRLVADGIAFREDMGAVRQSLVNNRLKQAVLVSDQALPRLSYFAEAVLASAPDWPIAARGEICRTAAEISEALAATTLERPLGRRLRIRAALLYELASLPALASSILGPDDLREPLFSFFRRKGPFGKLNGFDSAPLQPAISGLALGELSLVDDVVSYGVAGQQGDGKRLEDLKTHSVSSVAWRIGEAFDLGLTASELRAFSAIINSRIDRATVGIVEPSFILSLRKMGFPTELLPAQSAALAGGLLSKELPAWGFAAPTGSGKTFLARLLIADVLASAPETKVIYLVPSKALVSEVAAALGDSLGTLGYRVLAMSAQLVDLDAHEIVELENAAVVVMTPEKADMLLRLGAEFLDRVGLAVIDEAHHIESGTRGALLELYLWRLKRMLPHQCRYVLLSAVAPNLVDIARWLDAKGTAVTFADRPTRMRVGVYAIKGNGRAARGVISYSDGTSTEVIASHAEKGGRKGICQLAEFLQPAGPVLIVAKGKKESENIAEAVGEWLKEKQHSSELNERETASDTYKSLDASLEREMYSDVALRKLIKQRIAYHHAGLPPSVRLGVEEAIRQRLVDYVVATTTLAEGVNFPFSSVIVQSLALREAPERGRPARYSPVTPRTFWNIAGRAGRPGFDAEGQVILYEPSLGLDKIGAILDPYITPGLMSLAPVSSALAGALDQVRQELAAKAYTSSDLEKVALPVNMSRRARGAINLLRVGIVHAMAAKIIKSPEEIVETSFAATFFSPDAVESAKAVLTSQARAMDAYLAGGDAPSVDKLAELGLSLETLSELRAYVSQMADWQLENCEKLFYGGVLNLAQAPYIIGPVAKHMSELEGPSLGGFLSDVIVRWLSGVPFSVIQSQTRLHPRLEDLIAVIYSRVQYLLPWGLWATDWLVEQEAARRRINYNNQIKNLAYLADAGVPNFDALRLSHLKFERVDATRLSQAYAKTGGLGTGVKCEDWVLAQPRARLETVLRGVDNRRIAHGFFERLDQLRARRP